MPVTFLICGCGDRRHFSSSGNVDQLEREIVEAGWERDGRWRVWTLMAHQ